MHFCAEFNVLILNVFKHDVSMSTVWNVSMKHFIKNDAPGNKEREQGQVTLFRYRHSSDQPLNAISEHVICLSLIIKKIEVCHHYMHDINV